MSKARIVLSLLGKLDEVASKETAKKVSKAKQKQIDEERVAEALREEIDADPQYLNKLDDDEYEDLIDALPPKQRASLLGDDSAFEIMESQTRMLDDLSPKEAAENLELFGGAEEVYTYLEKLDAGGLKQFKDSVSSEDSNLYGPALDRISDLGVRSAKMKGGMIPREQYSKGKLVLKVWKSLGKKPTPDEEEIAKKIIKKPVKSKKHSDKPFVTRPVFKLDEDSNTDILLKKDYPKGSSEFQGKFLRAWQKNARVFTHKGHQYSVDEALPEIEIRNKKAEGGSMLVPPEMPIDTYDNIPEDEKEAAKASQLPDDEMEEDYTDYVLEESLDTEDQEYLMNALEGDERLSGIFDKVMDVAGEFSGEGEVEGLGTGVSDSIPARLSDGEFVFTKKATDQLGADQLQTMMDDAERAYDGGLMKKAFGGMVDDEPKDNDGRSMYSSNEEEEIKKQMITSNRMPSVR